MHSIGHDLGTAISGLQWVLDAYNLTYASLLLTGGLLADLSSSANPGRYFLLLKKRFKHVS